MSDDRTPGSADLLHEIEGQLTIERRAMHASIGALTRAFDEIVASIEGVGNDDEHDPEGATIAYERALVSSQLDTARTQLTSIDDALGRIAHGSFGLCANCGGFIGPDRLRALPTTATCIRCAL